MKRAAFLVVSATVVFTALALSVAQAYDYRGPTQPFPQGNPAAPIDTGTNYQERQAPLGFSASFTGPAIKLRADQYIGDETNPVFAPLTSAGRSVIYPQASGLYILEDVSHNPAKVVVNKLCFNDITEPNCKSSWAGIGGGGPGDSYWTLGSGGIVYASSTNPNVTIGGFLKAAQVDVFGNLSVLALSGTSPTGYVYNRIDQQVSPSSNPSYETPLFGHFATVWSAEFQGKTWEQVKITTERTGNNLNGATSCNDATMTVGECSGSSYTASVNAPDFVYELSRAREDLAGGGYEYFLRYRKFSKELTSRIGGNGYFENLQVNGTVRAGKWICLNGDCRQQWPAPNGDPFWTSRGDPKYFYTTALGVGIGADPGTTYRLNVVGKVNSTEGFFKNGVEITGGGGGGNDPRWVDVAGGSGMHYEGGKVGIGTGTAEPGAKLDANGTVLLSGTSANLDPAGYTISTSLQNSGKLLIGWNRSAGAGETDLISNRGPVMTGGGFAFYDYSNAGSLTKLATFTGSGGARLSVTNPETAGKQGRAEDAIRAYANAPVGAALSAEQDNAAGYALYADGGKNYFGGNVGIGTDSPPSKLSVLGNVTLLRAVGNGVTAGPGPTLAFQSPSTDVGTIAGNQQYCGGTGQPSCPGDSCPVSQGYPGNNNPAQTVFYECTAGTGGTQCTDVGHIVGSTQLEYRTVTCVAGTTQYAARVNSGTFELLNNDSQTKFSVAQNGTVRIAGGSPEAGKFLKATDILGNAVWDTVTTGGQYWTGVSGGIKYDGGRAEIGPLGTGGNGLLLSTAGTYAPMLTWEAAGTAGTKKWSIRNSDGIFTIGTGDGTTFAPKISITSSGNLMIPAGAGDRKVLTSDSSGNATWGTITIPPQQTYQQATQWGVAGARSRTFAPRALIGDLDEAGGSVSCSNGEYLKSVKFTFDGGDLNLDGECRKLGALVGEYIAISANPTSISVSIGTQGSVGISNGTTPYAIQTQPNNSIATAVLSGSTLVITGVANGNTTVVVRDSGGVSISVPVAVVPMEWRNVTLFNGSQNQTCAEWLTNGGQLGIDQRVFYSGFNAPSPVSGCLITNTNLGICAVVGVNEPPGSLRIPTAVCLNGVMQTLR